MRHNQVKSVPTFESQTFLAEIEGNPGEHRIKVIASPYYRTFLNTKFKKGDKVTISITNKKPNRTLAQNNYYWVYVNLIAQETGEDADALHELFKKKFIGNRVVDIMGEQVEITGSTKTLKRLGFGEFIDKIAELTSILPPPIENYGL